MANVIFKIGTKAAYTTLETKDENTLYWLSDSQEIYKGSVLYAAGREATDTLAGLMSASDKKKLDSIGEGGTTSAKDVIFDTNLVFTEEFGRYVPVDGKVTIPAEGKSWYEVLMDAFSQDKNPTITQPSVTLTASAVKAYEVGTTVTPSYSAVLNPGSYEYGPATGIVASAWSVTNSESEEVLTTASVSFNQITVGDDTDYSITAQATYATGAVPLTALGSKYADGQIQAGTKSATKSKISGFRNSFYGTLDTKDGTVNSDLVRSLPSKSGKANANGNTFNISIPVGAIRVMFAYPATLRDVSSVQDVNGMNAEIKSAFAQTTVSVEGANGYTGIDYKVYVMDMANANDTANTYKVTI